MREPIDIVREWHDAVNAGDIDHVVALVTDDVEVGGPRGSDRGVALMVDWLRRANIQLVPTSWRASGETVVAGQDASWRLEDGQATEPEPVASVFIVRDGRIASVVRHPNLATALAAASISSDDQE
jgi:ketosteroid isomerase-like protein